VKKEYLFIYSHRLKEVIKLVDHIFVMENGSRVWYGSAFETNEEGLVSKMSGNHEAAKEENLSCNLGVASHVVNNANEAVGVKLTDVSDSGLNNINFASHGGEIIGISGLEGNGQKELLHKIFMSRGKRVKGWKSTVRLLMSPVTAKRKQLSAVECSCEFHDN
jgi:ribose transport system ATP-binding protein